MYYYVHFRNGRNGNVLTYYASLLFWKNETALLSVVFRPLQLSYLLFVLLKGKVFTSSLPGASPGRSLVSLNFKAGSVPGHLLLDFGTTWTCDDAKTEIFKE